MITQSLVADVILILLSKILADPHLNNNNICTDIIYN